MLDQQLPDRYIIKSVKHTLILLDPSLTLAEPAAHVLACVLGPARVTRLDNFAGLAGCNRLLVCTLGQPGKLFMDWLHDQKASLANIPLLLLCLEIFLANTIFIRVP